MTNKVDMYKSQFKKIGIILIFTLSISSCTQFSIAPSLPYENLAKMPVPSDAIFISKKPSVEPDKATLIVQYIQNPEATENTTVVNALRKLNLFKQIVGSNELNNFVAEIGINYTPSEYFNRDDFLRLTQKVPNLMLLEVFTYCEYETYYCNMNFKVIDGNTGNIVYYIKNKSVLSVNKLYAIPLSGLFNWVKHINK